MIEKTFQTKLAKLRQDYNLSQKQLAEQIGVSQASINYWEKGQRTPSIDAAQKLANFFKIPISELLEPTTTKLFDDITSLFSGSKTLQIDIKGSKMNELFDRLNDKGQDKALEQVELLTKIPEYRKDTTSSRSNASETIATHARTDGQAHDNAIMKNDSE